MIRSRILRILQSYYNYIRDQKGIKRNVVMFSINQPDPTSFLRDTFFVITGTRRIILILSEYHDNFSFRHKVQIPRARVLLEASKLIEMAIFKDDGSEDFARNPVFNETADLVRRKLPYAAGRI